MNKVIFTYKFYRRDRNRKGEFIGSLIERRTQPERITCASIMNWAKNLSFKDVFEERVYLIRVEVIRSEPLNLQK